MNAPTVTASPRTHTPVARPVGQSVGAWLTSGLMWSAIVSAVCVSWVLFFQGGRDYYVTPLAVRAYSPAHPLLRPSGPIGQTLGVIGAALMLVPFIYMLRKRVPGLRSIGSARGWLEVHLFCGVVAPVLVTLHTSFKFNGIISAAYWSMVMVMLSGFIGRFLFVRIPRSIRGSELTRGELDARAESLTAEIADSVQSMELLERVRAFEASVVPAASGLSFLNLFVGELTLGSKAHRFQRELESSGLDHDLAHAVVALTRERATLLRRIAYLQKTKMLFGLWHVFHLPLVYLLLVIVVAHVGVALYLGYVPFRW